MMSTMKFVTVFATLIAVTFALQKNDCNKGPSYWCQDEATATKCGVQSLCQVLKVKDTKIKFESSSAKKSSVVGAPPVKVGFYYESLCPGCRQVWSTQVRPTYNALKSTGIVDFDFVPYGNAREQPYGSSWYFTCQHGANECYGNLVETCAIHYYPDPNKHIPFLMCLEQYGPYTYGSYCASVVKIDYTPIQTCANGDEGKQLEHQMALKTEQLSPPHQYVPWLTLNGQPSTALSNNMLATICNAYTGTKPAACSTSSKPLQLCYKK